MDKNLKIIVVNPPSEQRIRELIDAIKEFIQATYYS